ncbi:sigma-70 family RNA polymerase sigma factor [Actinotalea ferrariae]|uniref:RNA polymerase sigma factor n=1 Tax=Actinotalea ferrariae TaxID=1386098 RepID=UPI001C8B8956|nr:RNA polymerase sigma factor [Actinotalea ferrariae]MBX9246494.1 sigma-70 family RNA polymerase sigma factor [Actinotalea ferrariae]
MLWLVLDDFDRVLAHARRGSPEGFSAIYQDLVRPVAGYLRAQGVRDVEDATSEVFLSVFTGLARFEGDQAQLRAWVFTIAHRRAVDTFRRASRRVVETAYEAEDDVRTSESAEAGALDALGGQRVMEVLGTLTDEQREVLVLRIVADLTVEQVAEVTGRRAGAVKALQRRGLAALRRTLAETGVPL